MDRESVVQIMKNYIIFSIAEPLMFSPGRRLPQGFGNTEAEAWDSIGGPRPKGFFAREVDHGRDEYIRRKRHAKFLRPSEYQTK